MFVTRENSKTRNPEVEGSKFWVVVSALLLGICLCLVSPVCASATQVTRSIDSTLTVTMQASQSIDSADEDADVLVKAKKPDAVEGKGGGLAHTGDASLLLALGFLVLAAGGVFCAFEGRKLSQPRGLHAREAKQNYGLTVKNSESVKKKWLLLQLFL